jgi:orotate phosphoribosyltransferase
VRNQIESALAEMIMSNYPEVELLAGTSTAGIAHAAYVSGILNLPMAYVRGSAKDHGRQNKIEGRVEPKQKVVVIEDLISTAGSAVDVVESLREVGAEVLGIASIFDYGMDKGIERLTEAQVKNVSLSGFNALIDVSLEKGYIEESDVKKLLSFQREPDNSDWQNM